MTVRILSLVVLSIVIVALAACGSSDDGGEEATSPASGSGGSATQVTAPSVPSAPSGVVRVVNRDQAGSGEYRFDPAELRFEVGQEVTFSLSGETEFHTFTVEELGIDVSMDIGETVEYSHTFDRAGTFRLFCIPHEALGMTGEIVVE